MANGEIAYYPVVLLPMGSVHPVHDGMIVDFKADFGPRGDSYRTSLPKVFAGGDMWRGPVAGGVGDPRGPPDRARDRQAPDGDDNAAAVRRGAP
jgi:hypothetical protein